MDRVLRPKMQVLPDTSLVEREATHTVSGKQPYFLKRPDKGSEPAGTLPAGSKVALVSRDGGEMCVVQDAEGRQLYTTFAGLRPIK